MAFAAAQARLLSLTLHKSDLEYRITSLCNQKQQLATQASAYAIAAQEAGFAGNINDTPEMLAIKYQEDALDSEKTVIESQHQAITTELESTQKMVDNNIKKDFKLNLGS
ncbi:hypothetical protein IJE86_07385 [bacterium]|nr:hypothetical protein [bacterium]